MIFEVCKVVRPIRQTHGRQAHYSGWEIRLKTEFAKLWIVSMEKFWSTSANT